MGGGGVWVDLIDYIDSFEEQLTQLFVMLSTLITFSVPSRTSPAWASFKTVEEGRAKIM